MTASMPSPKDQWLNVFRQEHVTTLKVMRAFPPDQGSFQPHPRSQSAKRLMWTFVQEQGLISSAIKGTLKMPPEFAPEPATVADVIAAYDQAARETEQLVDSVHHRGQLSVYIRMAGGKVPSIYGPSADEPWM